MADTLYLKDGSRRVVFGTTDVEKILEEELGSDMSLYIAKIIKRVKDELIWSDEINMELKEEITILKRKIVGLEGILEERTELIDYLRNKLNNTVEDLDKYKHNSEVDADMRNAVDVIDEIKKLIIKADTKGDGYKMELVNTSYKDEDVKVLLQDLEGKVEILDTMEREKLNQGGVHYSEMLPKEYKPSKEYMDIYYNSMGEQVKYTVKALKVLAEKLYNLKGEDIVLVSLARAGTPIGILLKRVFKKYYGFDAPHYSVSIIRGKGIDKVAMHHIINNHGTKGIQFVDGWVGKGAISKQLEEACKSLDGVDPTLAVLSDPAGVTELCGTTQDFLIPSACLNSTVSGLLSRTVHKDDLITENEYHGAIFYSDLKCVDVSNEFLDKVMLEYELYMTGKVKWENFEFIENTSTKKGIEEVTEIAKYYGIDDVNKVKPGVGETTRVLLRRVPYKVLVREGLNINNFPHIAQLCREKGVEVEYYPLELYGVCGIIKDVADL